MTWSDETPLDNDPAHNIHIYLQQFKTSVRERFELDNGDFKEHYDSDDNLSGTHKPSITGFCGSWSSWGLKPSPKDHTLHYISDSAPEHNGVFYVKNGIYHRVVPISHNELTDTYKDQDGDILDPHPAYVKVNGSLIKDTAFNSLNTNAVEDGSSHTLPLSHKDLSWLNAHGESTITDRLLHKTISSQVPKISIFSQPIKTITYNGPGTFDLPEDFAILRSVNYEYIAYFADRNVSNVRFTSTQVKILNAFEVTIRYYGGF